MTCPPVRLVPLTRSLAPALFRLTDRNRKHLRRWLPWLDQTTSVADTEAFLTHVEAAAEQGHPQFGLYVEQRLCGVAGFHPSEPGLVIGNIGYWLDQDQVGRGIMTQAVKELVAMGFKELGFQRIEIRCATENGSSRAIPERLGFHQGPLLRKNEWLYTRHVDHTVYFLTRQDHEAMERAAAQGVSRSR